MRRIAWAVVAVVAVGFVGLGLAPAAGAVITIPIDIEKVVNGYSITIVGVIVIDEEAKSGTGTLTITVTDPDGNIVFERTISFAFTWASLPQPIWFSVPEAGFSGTVTVTPMGVRVGVLAFPRPQEIDGSSAGIADSQASTFAL